MQCRDLATGPLSFLLFDGSWLCFHTKRGNICCRHFREAAKNPHHRRSCRSRLGSNAPDSSTCLVDTSSPPPTTPFSTSWRNSHYPCVSTTQGIVCSQHKHAYTQIELKKKGEQRTRGCGMGEDPAENAVGRGHCDERDQEDREKNPQVCGEGEGGYEPVIIGGLRSSPQARQVLSAFLSVKARATAYFRFRFGKKIQKFGDGCNVVFCTTFLFDHLLILRGCPDCRSC